MGFQWFANILVYHPYIILIGVTVFSGTCLVIPFTLKNLPNFSDPELGYQTRGTEIANKLTTWYNLAEETKENGSLTVNPKEYLYRLNLTKYPIPATNGKKKKKNGTRNGKKVYGHVVNSPAPRVEIMNQSPYGVLDDNEHNWFHLHKFFFTDRPYQKIGEKEWSRLMQEGFFCGMPHAEYAHLVIEAADGYDLFTFEGLTAICRIEEEMIGIEDFEELCVRRPIQKTCCRPWSLPNYIASLHDRESCKDITEQDIEDTKMLLQNCAHYYHSAKAASDCSQDVEACKLPEHCHHDNAVFNILHYITSASFLPPNKTNDLVLRQTMLFLPIACSTATLKYYHLIMKKSLSYEGISVVAIQFGLKNVLFDEFLFEDTWLLSLGGTFIFISMWKYTESVFLTIMTIIAIVFSLGFSYFMYTLVFELTFFPFMNFLTIVVSLGIGTDNAFIFCKVWRGMKESIGGPLSKVMCNTIEHALLSMMITSFTTSAAFLASYVSSITAIKCFSVFSSMAVLSNCLIMIMWFPACVVVWERIPQLQSNPLRGCFSALSIRWCCLPKCLSTLTYRQICFHVPSCLRINENSVVEVILKFRYFWFCVLSIVAAVGSFIVLWYPKLQLPSSSDFQLFRSSHPFEQYEMVYKEKFWFAKSAMEEAEVNLPLRFVWGLIPQDNGNYLEPFSYGTLELDENFNMSHPDSQTWLVQFCQNLRAQPFYKQIYGLQLPNCFIDTFRTWMSRKCWDDMEDTDHTPCCESEQFPFRSWVFEKCIIDAIQYLYATPPAYYVQGVAGPKFSKDQIPTIKAVVVEYESNYTSSMSYEFMNNFINDVDKWFTDQMKTAPEMMRSGFFVTDMDFYDLQRILSNGTIIAIFVSMGLALIVLFLATLNILTSIFAIINIMCSILVTMAVLVLLGWQLNILESIAISTAIGLAVDFALHYTVSYKLSSANLENRLAATRNALSNMLKPVTMAALTTGMVGALMIPSSVMAYVQIGTFLVLVMSVSWLYSTFHLGAMLAIGGPQRNFAQWTYSQIFCNLSKRKRPKITRHQPATSSTSDTHELDLLTSKSGASISGLTVLRRSLSDSKTNRNRFTMFEESPTAISSVAVIASEKP